MPSIFLHHGKLWVQIKGLKIPDKWGKKRTEYVPGQEALAMRYAEIAQQQVNRRAIDMANVEPTGDSTVDDYAQWRFKGREGRISSVGTERGRYAHHIRPYIGHLRMRDVLPMHVRDMVRAHAKLVKKKEMAPRSARSCYAIARGIFRDAVSEQKIAVSPAGIDQLGKGELPKIVDFDGEWRERAVFDLWEVKKLISDPRILPDRRVQYALKALAGLRHSDMNVCRWRNYDELMEPLGRLVVVTPKTGVTRYVPVHQLLARILWVWKAMWPQIYGREPTPDDLIVPTRAMTPPDNRQSCAAFQRDLVTLSLRQEAGRFRNRGGHDLRSWFITSIKDDGAREDIIDRITHAKKTDVRTGYTRSRYAIACAEVAKLNIDLPDSDILPLITTNITNGENQRIRWASKARRMDRRSIEVIITAQPGAVNHDERSAKVTRSSLEQAEMVTRLSTNLATAVLAGDKEIAHGIATELAALYRRVTRLVSWR